MDGNADIQADWKIGVDIGGTFIDFCAFESRSGRVASLKVLTAPDNPGAELLTGLDLLTEREGLDPRDVSRFVHGTTVGINTILQRRGARLRRTRPRPRPAFSTTGPNATGMRRAGRLPPTTC